MVLEEFANKMAVRTGGYSAVKKLVNSKALGTIELSTGLQISGVFSNAIKHKGNPVYIQTTGATGLAYREKEIVGHSIEYHSEGFGSPIGALKGINLAIEDMSPRDLMAYDIYEGKNVTLEFEGDITVKGEIITGSRNLQGKIILISFRNCTVTHGEEILFRPEWGTYDMAVGKEIVSGFSGPADVNSFDMITHVPATKTIKAKMTPEREELESLYKAVRDIREGKPSNMTLKEAFGLVSSSHPNDWLLSIEIAELSHKQNNTDFTGKVLNHLEKVKQNRPEVI